jgi:copper(I)-binding protein
MKSLLLVGAVAATVMACGSREAADSTEGLTVRDVIIGESVLDDVASMYATFRNGGPEDTLRAVLIDGVGRVEVHDQWRDGDLMRMEPLPNLILPEGETVILEPGGMHFMLMDITAVPAVGDSVDILFQFATSGTLEARAPVVGLADILSREPAGGRP